MLRVRYHVVSIKNIDEDYPADLPADKVAEYIALEKATAYRDTIGDDELVITADTVVILDGKIYGKPCDKQQAIDMLTELSGKTHSVCTGVAITTKDRQESFSCFTDVAFADIDPADIRYYVNTYNPLDKAGAYGIQEWIGAIAVKGIYGSYYNVMGLPVHLLYQHLKSF